MGTVNTHRLLFLVPALLTACNKDAPKNEPRPGATPAPTVVTPAEPIVEDPPGATEAPPPDGEPATPENSAQSESDRRLAALKSLGPDYEPRTHHFNPDGSPKYINELIYESSPYLLQHAHNPVEWHAWGDAAFEKAKRLNRPVLLSVGYATCHWCHVMEKESFEDEEIAKYMSDNFVCIKVDREERPDVDNVYMTAVHMLHGRGGWPMTVVMTPDREPFFGGTYFPPRDGARGARKGFLTILGELKQQYETDRDGVVAKAQQISRRIAAQSRARPAAGVPDHTALQSAANRFASIHDKVHGGFGRRPKFPRPVTMEFLLRYYRRSKDKRLLDAVTLTLDKMAMGGIHDQIGGGFHRYAVDNIWLVPHFEKMLYDNGQLVCLYVNAWQITKKPLYAAVARKTLDYALREMRDPEGGFWSATDADSEGHEGTFFVWTPDEIREILGPELAEIAIRYWGVTAGGNFEHKNILNVPRPPARVAEELGMTEAALATRIEVAARKLYVHRSKRIPPLTDDKVLTAWNGMMISGLARAAFVLNEPKYAVEAAKASRFVLANLMKDGRLLRTWKRGRGAKHPAYLEDYAFFGQALLDLYEATNDLQWLRHAIALHTTAITHYEDTAAGGFFRTAHDAEKLLARNKPDYDGAQPGGNSIIARNLLRLSDYTGDATWRQTAERTLKWAGHRIQRSGAAVPAMLGALDHYLDETLQVFVVDGADTSPAEGLLSVLRGQYLPNRLLTRASETAVATVAATIPAASQKTAQKGKTTAYVCERGVCKRPTSDPKVLSQQLAVARPYVESTPAAP